MLLYNLRLAWQSLRRHPLLSALIVGGIALGVGVATPALTMIHVLTGDPIPERSGVLYYVRMDSWDPAAPYAHPSGIPPQITYRDLREIEKSRIPVRQTAGFLAALYVYPDNPDQRPSKETVRLASSDFFPMFDAPFRYGSGWDKAADARPEAVVVVSDGLNRRLFGGGNSVGRSIRIADREFRVVGVLAPWRFRTFRFYDMVSDNSLEPESIFMPFNWTEPMEIRSIGTRSSWKAIEGNPTYGESLHTAETVFLQMWVELADPAQAEAYHRFLDAYAREQKRLGRFQRRLDNRVTPLRDLLAEWKPEGMYMRPIAAISVLFFLVASLNLIGLFLGKFLAKAPIVGIRRALGASRASIFLEHLIECELVGLLGGGLGLLISVGALAFTNKLFERMVHREDLFQLDATMVLAAVLLSLVSGAIAGIYPAWRICSIPPARHLKNP